MGFGSKRLPVEPLNFVNNEVKPPLIGWIRLVGPEQPAYIHLC